MNIRRTCVALLVMAFAFSGLALASGSSSTPTPRSSTPEATQTPEQLANERYNQGVANRKRAAKLTAKLAEATTEKQREKLEAKIKKAYESAVENHGVALGYERDMHQAYSEIGFALRKLGRFDESLRAYGQALSLSPEYAPAIEYRAEAYLALNRTAEAKQEYLRLFAIDRKLADELLEAMEQFVKKRRGEPAGLTSDSIDALATWVEERREIAEQTTNARLRGGSSNYDR